MATPKIILNISNGQITATAVDQNGNTIPGGDLHMNPSGVIHWSHAAANADELKQFVVRFLDAGNNERWPFQSPPPKPTDLRLRVHHNQIQVTKLAKVTNVDWRYKVAMNGYTELDPMIIIRGHAAKVSTVAVVLAVIGALAVAGLLSWWFL